MEQPKDQITRKEAIKKLGKYAAITAIGTYSILNPLKAAQDSLPPGPGSLNSEAGEEINISG